MDTVNAKRDGRPFTGVSIIIERVPPSDPPWKIETIILEVNDINDISFFGTSDFNL
jgi:hypothetical protein